MGKTGQKDITNVAVVYARYSSHAQGEQSIEGQLSAAAKYAEGRGYTIIHEYIDRAVSGRTDNRFEFQKMLSDCAKHQFSVIIVWKVDRFGRNRDEIMFNKYRAKKHGVRVEYVAESVPEGPEGVILESVLEGMAEYYSLQLAQNVARGLYESAKKHKVINGPIAYGYKAGPDKEYMIDEEQAATVRLIYRLYDEGMSQGELIRYLSEKGITARRGKPFRMSTLARILHNPKYKGTYIYKDLICDEDAIPAIVDKDLWQRCQDRAKANRRQPYKAWTYSDYLLTDKLYCARCGAMMIGMSGAGKSGRKYEYYACGTQRRRGGCDRKAVRKDVLERVVLSETMKLLQDQDRLDAIIDATWELVQKQDSTAEELAVLRSRLSETEAAIRNLLRLAETGLVSDVIADRLRELEASKKALERSVAEKELDRSAILTRDHIQYFIEQFRSLDYEDRRCQKRLVEAFINRIYVSDTELHIAYNTGEESSTACPSFPLNGPQSNTWITTAIKIPW